MFSGLVERRVRVGGVIPQPPGMRLEILWGEGAAAAKLGDSIAVNGCCLTVTEIAGDRLAFEAGSETLSRTNLGRLRSGSEVNVERSLRLGDQIGGHLVTGHVDGLGTLDFRRDDGPWSHFYFQVPRPLLRQMASKGSVAVDGVSLTLVDVEEDRFSVALIPHTLLVTTLGALRVGDVANIETDLLAKYVERQLGASLVLPPPADRNAES